MRALFVLLFLFYTNFVGQVMGATASFNCDGTDKTDIAVLLCSDPELSKLDVEMAKLVYRLVPSLPEERRADFLQKHSAWKSGRTNQCSIPSHLKIADVFVDTPKLMDARSCLVAHYGAYVAALTNLSKTFAVGSPNVSPQTLTPGTYWGALLHDEYPSRIEAFARARALNRQFPSFEFVALQPTDQAAVWRIALASYTDKPTAQWWAERAKLAEVPEAQVKDAVVVEDMTVVQAGQKLAEASTPTASVGIERDIVIDCIRAGHDTVRGMFSCSGLVMTPKIIGSCLQDGICGVDVSVEAADAMLSKLDRTWNQPLAVETPDLNAPWINGCMEQAGNDHVSFENCVDANVIPSKPSVVANCDLSVSPDVFGRCVIANLPEKLREPASCLLNTTGKKTPLDCLGFVLPEKLGDIQKCVMATSGNRVQIAVKCFVKTLDDDASKAASCLIGKKLDVNVTMTCLSMLPNLKDAVRKVQCFQKSTTIKIATTTCAPLFGVKLHKTVVSCLQKVGVGSDAFLKCLPQDKDENVQCLRKNHNDLDKAMRCIAIASGYQVALLEVVQCASSAGQVSDLVIACNVLQLKDMERRVLGCAFASSGDDTELITCASQLFLNDEQRRILQCALASDGYMSFGLCLLGISLNPEWATAAQCWADTGGEPVAWGSCTAGKLTTSELQKCTRGIGGEGCFGDSNTLVMLYKGMLGDQDSLEKLNQTFASSLSDAAKKWEEVTQKVNDGWAPIGPPDKKWCGVYYPLCLAPPIPVPDLPDLPDLPLPEIPLPKFPDFG
ncbi:hypothetical protein [Rhizobium leguminosarum]|uniref:hypothetical protein n=1 Tax=Rhizobium leguminosarum TaxID=384 RepID=UPI001442804C|nr:hypothetical protein [Rhizobium leguminosarum]NKL77998.1 hypothetical protein [Rhizobium leguminosarum bv. viciae]